MSKEETFKILLVGFGRMGVTHLSIISGLLVGKSLEVYVVDNSFASRSLAKEIIGSVSVFKGLSDVKKRFPDKFFDVCFITTPPIGRAELVDMADALSKKIFVEKPLMMMLEQNQMSGYVLQHSPLNKSVFDLMSQTDIVTVNARLTTNISFASVESGWRSGKFGSVLYEFGGHLLTLIGSTSGRTNFLSNRLDLDALSISGVQDDYICFDFVSEGIKYNIELIAGSADVRKASYEIEYISKDTCYKYDLYSLISNAIGVNDGEKIIMNVASTETNVPFYVRGFEFSLQMQALLDGKMDVLSKQQLKNIEDIIEGVC